MIETNVSETKKPTNKFAGFWYVVRVEGFEPPTTWFVARYSIQLSYTRFQNLTLTLNGGEGGIRTLGTNKRTVP